MVYIIGLVGVVLIFAADRVSKFWAVRYLLPVRERVLIEGVFSLRFHTNDGAAFNIFSGQWLFLSIGTGIIMAVLVYFYVRLNKYVPQRNVGIAVRAALVMILGGALGNWVDRVRYPHEVVDFFWFSLINFPIFNVADIFITCGSIFLCVLLIFFVKEEKKEEKKDV